VKIPESSSENLFEAIAQLLEPARREYFYQRMLYFRQLRQDDEILRIMEALGFLALIIHSAPQAVASEREQLATLLATSIASIQATAEATQAYHAQLEDRLTGLPQGIVKGLSPEAIARTIIESVRQQFVQSGLPVTADALSVVSNQLNHATGDLKRTAGQLASYTDVAGHAKLAIEDITRTLNNAVDNARWAANDIRAHFTIGYNVTVAMFCGGALVLGAIFGFSVQGCGTAPSYDMPPSPPPTVQTAPPAPRSSPPPSPPKKPRQEGP
jgi:hypothetical protein